MTEKQADYITDAMEMIGMNEPKEIIQTVSGFVPVFDILVERYEDPLTALVFGRRWQYCRMQDGVCRASLETIANDLKISRATVMRHTELLVEDGYLIDLTPDLKNKPHVYADAGKIIMKSQLTAHVSQRNVTVSQRNTSVSESHLSNTSKQSIKHQQEEEAPAEQKSVFAIYEQEIGLLTPMIADALEDWEKDVPVQWIEDAIREAVQNNARNWKYAEAILKRWKAQGHQGKQEKAQSQSQVNTGKPKQPGGFEVIKDWLERTTGSEIVNG